MTFFFPRSCRGGSALEEVGLGIDAWSRGISLHTIGCVRGGSAYTVVGRHSQLPRAEGKYERSYRGTEHGGEARIPGCDHALGLSVPP